jgi:hypothetical protein
LILITFLGIFTKYRNSKNLSYQNETDSDSDSYDEFEKEEAANILTRRNGHQKTLRVLAPKSYRESSSESEKEDQRKSFKITKKDSQISQDASNQVPTSESNATIVSMNDSPMTIENGNLISLPSHFPISISLKTTTSSSYGDTCFDDGVLSNSSPEADNEPYKLQNNSSKEESLSYTTSTTTFNQDDMHEIEQARFQKERRFINSRAIDDNNHQPSSQINLPLLNPIPINLGNEVTNKSPINKKNKTNNEAINMGDIDILSSNRTNPVQLKTLMELNMNELPNNPVDYSLEDLYLPYSPSNIFNSSFSPDEFSPSGFSANGFSPNGFSPIESNLFSRYRNSSVKKSRKSISNNDLNMSISSVSTSDSSHLSLSNSSISSLDEKNPCYGENIRLSDIINCVETTESATTTTDYVSIDEEENEDIINNNNNNRNDNNNFNNDNINISRVICKSPTSVANFVAPSPPINFHPSTFRY